MKESMTQTIISVGITLALLLRCAFSPIPVLVAAQTPVTVSIDAPAEVTPDSHFIARVNVTELSNFDAGNYDVTYDPSVIELTEITSGEIGGTTIPSGGGLIPAGEQGRARVIVSLSGLPGVNGSGYLTEIHFHVIGSPGNTSNIDLSNGILGDTQANPITPVTWEGDMVTIIAVMPSITVTKSANPTNLEEPGGTVTFTVGVTNSSVETVTLISLIDTPYGNLADPTNTAISNSTCVTGGSIAANGGAYTCSFQAHISGEPGIYTDTVTATAEDDEGNVAVGADDATVEITQFNPSPATFYLYLPLVSKNHYPNDSG